MFKDFIKAIEKLDSKIRLLGLVIIVFGIMTYFIAPKIIDAMGGDAASLRRQLEYRNGEIAILTLDMQRLNSEIRDLNGEIRRIERDCTERIREHEMRTYKEMTELRNMVYELIMVTCSIAEPSEVHINSPAIRHIPTEPYIEEVVPSQLIIQKANRILERIDIKMSELKNGS